MKISALIVYALALTLLVACGDTETAEAPAANTPSLHVWTVEVTRESIAEPVVGTGTIAAHKTSNIGPRIDGLIEEIYVRVGDRVEGGAPLFKTRDTNYRIQVAEAENALRLARAESQKAARDKERVETLADSGVASTEQLDAVRTNFEMSSARLGAASASLEGAKQNLTDTLVVAPYSGVITARLVDEGVMMRTMLSSNSHVVQLMKTDIVAAIVQIPAAELARIHVGTPATLYIDGLPNPFESAVLILNDRVDPLSRAFEVRIPIENQDLAVKPGLFVRAELRPEPRQALVVERRAVLGSSGHQHVFVSESGLASQRSIEARDLDAKRVEVVSGLVAGDQVLAGPSLPKLIDGTPVSIQTAHVDL